MPFTDWRGVRHPNEGTIIYVRVSAPVSIDQLRRWFADGWTLACRDEVWYTFSHDLGRDPRKKA